MTIYTEESLYALSLAELVELCQERQVTPLSSNPRWKKSYVPALLAAQDAVEVPPQPEASDAAPVEEASMEPEPMTTSNSPVEEQSFSLTLSPWDEEPDGDADPISSEQPLVQEQGESTLSPTSAVYPIVFLLLIAWVALQVMIGIVSVFVFFLKHLAQKADSQATKHLEELRTPATSPPVAVTV